MSIQFACIHCDQRLSVSRNKVGSEVKCPQCKAPLVVPDEAEAAAILDDRRRRREAEKDNPFSQFAVFDEEPEIVYEHELSEVKAVAKPKQEAVVDPDRVAIPRLVLYTQGVLLGAVAIVAFALGIVVGGAWGPSEAEAPAETGPHVMSGALYFEAGGQATPPDVDALVILLPREARPEEKPDSQGLRPGDPRPDHDLRALQAIREIGGDYARTNADGRFQLNVPRGGRYYVLLVSQQQQRSGNQPLDPNMLARLGGYFQNAQDLIGNRAYQWREERLRSDKTLTHVFQ